MLLRLLSHKKAADRWKFSFLRSKEGSKTSISIKSGAISPRFAKRCINIASALSIHICWRAQSLRDSGRKSGMQGFIWSLTEAAFLSCPCRQPHLSSIARPAFKKDRKISVGRGVRCPCSIRLFILYGSSASAMQSSQASFTERHPLPPTDLEARSLSLARALAETESGIGVSGALCLYCDGVSAVSFCCRSHS